MPPVARRPWAVGALIVLATPALLPLLSAAAAWASPAGEVWAHQLQYVLPRVAGNTALLLLIVGVATGTLGTALAWLVAGHEFPGRSIFAWALLLPLAVPLPEVQWSATYVLLLLWTGALASAFGFVLWIGVLRFLTAGTASLNMLAIPVIALLSSMLVFGERLAPGEWAGIGCIGVGLALVSLRAWLAARRGERSMVVPLEGG